MIYNHVPVYNLSAVLKETGLKAELLRAWERRYNMPAPQRTSGGHRLYSDYDIAVIKWLHDRQKEGLSISSAVELWKEMTQNGQHPLQEYSPGSQLEKDTLVESSRQIEILRQSWIKACLAFNPLEAGGVINRAFAIYPIEMVCTDLLQMGLREIGDLWYQGKITVQQEHFASNLAVRRLETLIAASPNPNRNQTILLACPAGEWHTFPALTLNLFLRRKGFNVVYLGANTPLDQLEQTAAAVNPSAVVLAAQQLTSAASVKAAALIFQKTNIPLAYGGLIFNRIPDLLNRLPAIFLGGTLKDALNQVDRVVSYQVTPSATITEDSSNISVLFHSKKTLVESRVVEQFQNQGLDIEHFDEVNDFLSSRLTAALFLGDPAFVEPDLEWVKKLLEDRNISNQMAPYLNAYLLAVNLVMGSDGAVISNWMSAYLNKLSG